MKNRSPIYMTRSTRVLYPQGDRRLRTALIVLGFAGLLLLGIALGYGAMPLLGRSQKSAVVVTTAVPTVETASPAAQPEAGATQPQTAASGVTERLRAMAGQPSAQSIPQAQVTAAPTTTAAAAAQAEVAGTDGLGLVLRAGPNAASQPVGVLPEGSRLSLSGAEQVDSGRTWRRVQSAEHGEGWVAAEYLKLR